MEGRNGAAHTQNWGFEDGGNRQRLWKGAKAHCRVVGRGGVSVLGDSMRGVQRIVAACALVLALAVPGLVSASTFTITVVGRGEIADPFSIRQGSMTWRFSGLDTSSIIYQTTDYGDVFGFGGGERYQTITPGVSQVNIGGVWSKAFGFYDSSAGSGFSGDGNPIAGAISDDRLGKHLFVLAQLQPGQLFDLPIEGTQHVDFMETGAPYGDSSNTMNYFDVGNGVEFRGQAIGMTISVDVIPPGMVLIPISQLERDSFSEPDRKPILDLLKGRVRSNRSIEDELNVRPATFEGPCPGGGDSCVNSGGGVRGSLDPDRSGYAGFRMNGELFEEGSPAWIHEYTTFDSRLTGDLKFQYAPTKVGDGDWLELRFNGEILWSNFGQTLEEGRLYDAVFDASRVAGQAGDVAFILQSRGDRNAGFFLPYDLTFQAGGAVPEPTTWALMIAGFGMAGGMLRRRRAVAV